MSTDKLIKPVRIHGEDRDNDDYGNNSWLDYRPIKSYLNGLAVDGVTYESDLNGRFLIFYADKCYFYWPKSGKWRLKGKSKIYKSKDISFFIKNYVLNYYRGGFSC